MARAIAMPKLGMTMQEGMVVDWPVALGEHVEKGETVLVIESEKSEVEIEASASGTLRHIYVEAGETVPCGTLLACLAATPGEEIDLEAFRRENDRPEAAPVPAAPVPATRVDSSKQKPSSGRTPVAPAARALARKLGLDPGQVPGSGPGGRVTRQDVEAWAARREGLVEVAPGVRLEIPSEGEGEPVLLLPGFGSDASSFAFQSAVLSKRRRVLAVNPRGVGLSDAPDLDCYEVVTTAADAFAVSPEPAHVIGASLGAAVALELALNHPDRVRSLTLVTPFLSVGARLGTVIDAWCRIAREVRAETLARALLPWLFSEGFLQDERVRERTLRGLVATVTNVPATTLERTAAGLSAWSGTRMDSLGAVSAPTLVVLGGADLLTRDGESVARAIPGAQLHVVPEAGHAVAIEAPDEVNEAILTHLG